jgi:hypothetical protein
VQQSVEPSSVAGLSGSTSSSSSIDSTALSVQSVLALAANAPDAAQSDDVHASHVKLSEPPASVLVRPDSPAVFAIPVVESLQAIEVLSDTTHHTPLDNAVDHTAATTATTAAALATDSASTAAAATAAAAARTLVGDCEVTEHATL